MAHRKFHSVTITPTCKAAETENGEILFNPTKIPGACLRSSSSLLKSISMIDFDDHKAALDLWFFKKETPTLGTLGGVISATDAALLLMKPLGCVTISAVSDNALGDGLAWSVHTLTDVNLVVDCDEESSEGEIYVAGVATATKTFTASGIQLTFGFEVL